MKREVRLRELIREGRWGEALSMEKVQDYDFIYGDGAWEVRDEGVMVVMKGEEEVLEMGGMMVGGVLVGNAQMGGCMVVTQEERE